MGGKGQRRREKNYRAAHGGEDRLPPPPKATDLDVIPSKLRRIIQLTAPRSPNSSIDAKHKKRKVDFVGNQKTKYNHTSGSHASKFEGDVTDGKMTASQPQKDRNDSTSTTAHDKKKVRKKKKAVTDLRFQDMLQDLSTAGLSKRKRKKKFLDERKKRKKVKAETLEFPRHEKIKFGEVVEAPPKLNFPKSSKAVQDASQERLRLQAIEAYRSHKGWVSRPGLHLPPITPDQPSRGKA